MIVALDTNILAYAEGANDAARQAKALDLIAALPTGGAILPVQVLGELFRVLTAKVRRPVAEVRTAILSWRDAMPVHDTTDQAMLSAMDLVADHGLQIWDALILAVAADARCRLLLSEDLQDGFTWHGVTVVNPFAPTIHPLLAPVLTPAVAAG
ncbi:MAG TPA: PIN domain-containing protein [Candidatus Omnitrophota bacterium]|nr:PIN domain-containing protein [Candidatus Omnitrophota bacterium]